MRENIKERGGGYGNMEGCDYNIYKLNLTEAVTGFLAGLLAGIFAVYIMFGEMIVSVVMGVVIGAVSISLYKKHLLNKRKKIILLQFRDMLDSLSNSFSAGKNTLCAFTDAYADLKLSYGEAAPIVKELSAVVKGLYNNFSIEYMLESMSVRCGLEDIDNFAETFTVCNRMGGNLKRIVSESKDIINDKIDIEMEIQAAIASNKNEINILCVMPFIIIALMKLVGVDTSAENSFLNVTVKIIAIVMFIIAYVLGRRIADIKV